VVDQPSSIGALPVAVARACTQVKAQARPCVISAARGVGAGRRSC
jgi:hypothetical protein